MVYFLVFVLFLSAFAAGVWFMLRRLGRKLGERVGRLHAQAEHILDCGLPPADWRQEARSLLPRTDRNGAATLLVEMRLRRLLRRRLDRLVRYFRSAPVFEDQDSRRILLRELQEAGRRWKDMTVGALLGQEEFPDRGPGSTEGVGS